MAVSSRRVTVRNPLGLHARPATKLVTLVNGYMSKVKIVDPQTNTEAAGNSVISVLSLGAPQFAELEITVEGDDADEAANAIAELFDSGFGEEG